MFKRLFFLLSFLPVSLFAASVNLNVSGGITSTDSETINNLVVNGNTTLGNASGDSVTQNAATVTLANDTAVTLTGGVNGINFGSNTLSIDATNARVGIGTAAPTSTLHVIGDATISSNTVIDAFTASFGAVTAGSTSTVTWTEVTDRLSEFVTSSFTATTAGFYEIIAHTGVSQTAGTGCLLLKKNSALITGGEVCTQGVTGLASVLDLSFTRILNLAANDIVRFDASATTANATFQKMTFTIKRIP